MNSKMISVNATWERRFEWKATWGRLEIKIYVVGMEYIDPQHKRTYA